MAIVKGAFHSELASGNVGSLCASRWRGLQIIRDAWTGEVPNTSAQQTYQGHLTTCAQYWGGTLTAAQRQLWEEQARSWQLPNRFGEPYHPSGYILFMHVNMIRKRHAKSITAVPLEIPSPAMGMNFQITVEPSIPRTYMRFYTWIGSPDRVEFWKAGPYESGGRRALAGEFRFKEGKPAGSLFYDYAVTYGKWYWYKARWIEYAGTTAPFHIQQVQII